MDELEDVKPSEVSFIERLKLSKYFAVFHVVIRNRECAMKVVSDLPFESTRLIWPSIMRENASNMSRPSER